MNKNELVEMIKGALEAKRGEDAKVTKKAVAEMLDDIDTIVEVLAGADGLAEGTKVKLGSYLTIVKKEVAPKSGKMVQKDGTEVEYTTEAHNVLKVKVSKTLDVE